MKKHNLTKVLAVTLSTGLVITSAISFSKENNPVKASDKTSATSTANNTALTPPDGNAPTGTPKEKPDGDLFPVSPGGISGQIPNGNQTAPGSENSSITLNSANTADGTDVTYDGTNDFAGLSSTKSDENTVLAINGGSYTLVNAAISKSGNTSNTDNSNFYALNAIAAATENSSIYISSSTLTSDSEGSNALFATGSNAKIYASHVTIKTDSNSSRGIDATYEGTIVASDVDITTTGAHCGAIATDRGGGYISVDGAKLNTAGQGSPLIYSTGVIEVTNATGEATGAQIVGMEGLNTVRIKNSTLTGSGKKASDPIANGVILYQSTSGDSSTGVADFQVSDSTLKSHVENGAMFYVTNTDANIVLSNTILDFDSDSNTLLTVAGNDGSNHWGTAGKNGGNVIFTAMNETLSGDISCDGISNVTLFLTDGSTYTGTIINNTAYTGDGGVSMNLASGTTWTVTGDTSLVSLSQPDGAIIQDTDGKTVTIKTTDGTIITEGTSSVTITTDAYTTKSDLSSTDTITEFTIDRTAFDSFISANGTGSTSTAPATSSSNNTDNTSKTTKPAKTVITKLKASKTSIQVSWKKISDSEGYIIYRSAKKNGAYKKIATVKGTNITVYTNRSLKKNKKYYYKIRTYKTNNGSKIYGKYSAVRCKKTKK